MALTRHPVRCPRASAIEKYQAAQRRQLFEEVGNVGVLPRHLDVAAKPVEEEKVGGSLSEHLVGNVSIPDGDVLGVRTAHETFSLTRDPAPG